MQVVSGLACTKLGPNLGQTCACNFILTQLKSIFQSVSCWALFVILSFCGAMGIPSGRTGFANHGDHHLPFHFSKQFLHLVSGEGR